VWAAIAEFFGRLFAAFLTRRPPAAERAGAAEEEVKAYEQDNARLQAAADARARVAADSLHDGRDEAAACDADPYCRD